MYIYFNKAKAFLETFNETGLKLLKFLQFLIFILLGEKMLVENGARVAKTSELRYPPTPFWKFFKKLPAHSTPLCKSIIVSQNCVFLFVLKIFSQFIVVCPINLLKFCKFPSLNCSACSVRL